MTTEYKRLKEILNKKFHLRSSEISQQKDLVNDFGFAIGKCNIFFKVENEFNINLLYSTIPESITVHHLLKDIKIAPDILRVIILRLITDFLLLRNEQGAQECDATKAML